SHHRFPVAIVLEAWLPSIEPHLPVNPVQKELRIFRHDARVPVKLHIDRAGLRKSDGRSRALKAACRQPARFVQTGAEPGMPLALCVWRAKGLHNSTFEENLHTIQGSYGRCFQLYVCLNGPALT